MSPAVAIGLGFMASGITANVGLALAFTTGGTAAALVACNSLIIIGALLCWITRIPQ